MSTSAARISHIQSKHTKTPSHKVTLLVLLADTPIPAVQQRHPSYHDVFTSLFQRSLDAHPENGLDDVLLTIKSYDVVDAQAYPDESEIHDAAAVLITGSAASAYEDKAWIHNLTRFTGNLNKSGSTIKTIGICYGHQIVAQAYGGKCERNSKGWELGVRDVNLTDIGKTLLGNGNDTLAIHQVHRDHVPAVPSGFANLGTTSDCDVHGLVLPKDAASLADARIITLQGHPEFSPFIVTSIIDAREKSGVLDASLANRSRGYAAMSDEGVRIGSLLLRAII